MALVRYAIADPLQAELADGLDEQTSGPIYAAVADAAGVRYRSDEFNHRLIIETAGSELRFLGGPGSGPGEFRYPRGLAILPGDRPANGRLFVCDAWNHRIQILDLNGRVVKAFGAVGAGDGQFDVPSDIALVAPRFPGEIAEDVEGLTDFRMIAVADRWNNRVQIFSLDGAFVAAIGGAGEHHFGFSKEGWPFFRLGTQPATFFPTGLSWRAPYLDVTCANGRLVRIDLALALLPDFDVWLRGASLAELKAARTFLRRGRGPTTVVPPHLAARLDTELGRRLLADGRVRATARLWKAPWPAHLGGARIEEQLAERVAILEPTLRHCSGEPTAESVRQALTTKIAGERRERGRAAARRLLAWRRHAARPGTGRSARTPFVRGRFEDAVFRFDRIGALDAASRAQPASQPHITVWTAPTGDRRLQHLAVSGAQIAVASSDGRALWIMGTVPISQNSKWGQSPLSPLRVPLSLALAPVGVAAHPDGGWLVSDEIGDRIFHVRPDGAVSSIALSQASHVRLRGPNGLAVADRLIYVADRDRDRVQVFTLSGRAVGAYARLSAPTAVTVDGAYLWVSQWGTPCVQKLRRDTGAPILTLTHPDLFAPGQIVRLRTSDPTLLVADTIGGGVHAFSETGEWRGIAHRLPGRMGGLALVPDPQSPQITRLVVADQSNGALVAIAHTSNPEDLSWEQ